MPDSPQTTKTAPVLPAISVAIMTHNDAEHIADTIESVLAQTFDQWELIVSDDASTDETPARIAPFLGDPRISYVRHASPLGQGRNWAFSLKQGVAPLLAVLHGDDLWLPDTLQTVIKEFESDPEIDAVYGNWTRLLNFRIEDELAKPVEDHLYTGLEELEYQIQHNTMLASFTFVRRNLAQRVGDPEPDLKAVVDNVWLQKASRAARKVRALPRSLGFYRQHANNASHVLRRNGILLDEIERLPMIMRPLYRTLDCGTRFDRLQRSWSAEQLFSAGINRVLQGDSGGGWCLMCRGVRLYPSLLWRPIRLMDYVLTPIGPLSRPVLGMLHSRRRAEMKARAV